MQSVKVETIAKHFASAIRTRLIAYETAEILLDNGAWDAWDDLPIRLHTSAKKVISISWSKFDDLWIGADMSLPFSIEGQTIRWVKNSIKNINPAIGRTIQSVLLGQGQMSLERREIEIWTRLLIQLNEGWLEIFNDLNKNGYDFHPNKPEGQFIPCF